MKNRLRLWYAVILLAALIIIHGCSSGLTNVLGTVLISIEVTPSLPSIPASASQQFTATGKYSDNSTHDLTNSVTWISSDTSKANITNSGLATAIAAGTTMVKASLGSISGTATMTITRQDATLTSISVTPENPGIAVATAQQFIATGTYSDNTTQNITGSVTWSASDAAKATISVNGLALGTSAGSTTITAMSGGISGETMLTITPAELLSITVYPAAQSVAAGAPWQFSAVGTYSDTTTQDITNTVIWSSSNTATATISASGLATSAAPGTVTILATFGRVSGSTSLTVTAPALRSIQVAPANSKMQIHGLSQFTATGTYSDNTTQDFTGSVTWTSSDTAVATISAAGEASGLTNGFTTITATSGDVSGSTLLTVSLPPVTITSSIQSPVQLASGLTVTFTAEMLTPGNYEYLFKVKAPGSTSYVTWWNASSTYSSKNTWMLNEGTMQVGVYNVQVYVRAVGSLNGYDYIANCDFEISTPDLPASATLATLVASPLPAGTHVTFIAGTSNNAYGCQYQFKLKSPDGTEKVLVDFYYDNTLYWDTYGLTPGEYSITVTVKSSYSTAAYDATKAILFTIDPMTSSPLPVSDPYKYGRVLNEQGTGNHYVVGLATGFVAKYDANWNLAWNTSIGGWIKAAAFDNDGNIVIAGTPGKPFIKKLDTAGNVLWSWVAPSSGPTPAFAFDKDNNIYVTYAMWSVSGNPGYLSVSKLDANGIGQWTWTASPSWVVSPTGCSNGPAVTANGIVADTDAGGAIRVHVSGTTPGNVSFEGIAGPFFLTFDAAGNKLSNVGVSHGGGKLFKDGQGNYITFANGQYVPNMNPAFDMTKFSEDGTIVWQKHIVDAKPGVAIIMRDIIQDQLGNFHTLAEYPLDDTTPLVTNEYSGIYITKIDADGNKVRTAVGGTTPEEQLINYALSIDQSGNSYAATYTYLPGPSSYSGLVKFDSAGNQVWIK